MLLPDPRLLPPDVRAAAAWTAHEAYDVAPWPELEYWNPEIRLRRHQRTGSAWMYLGGLEGTLLADTVGSGKTFCAAATLAMCAQNGELGPGSRAVVVCGAAAVGQWAGELRKVLPGIPVVTAAGDKRQRVRAYSSPWQVLVVSSENLRPSSGRKVTREGDADILCQFPLGSLFYDDIDPMRNRETATARVIRALAAGCGRVHGLHGTPLQKKLPELYCALEPVGSADIFGTLDEFRQRYVTQERVTIWIPVKKAFPSERAGWARKHGYTAYADLTRQARADREAGLDTPARALAAQVETGQRRLQRVLWKDNGANADRLPEFQRMIAPVVLRRTSFDDVEMPEVQPAPHYIPLLAAQRRRYDELRQGVVRMLRSGTEEITHAKAAAAWTRGAQICSGLATLDGPGGDVSAKLDRIIADVTGDLSEEKVIAFVYYKPNVAALSARLDAEGIGHVLLWSGETDAAVREERRLRFTEDPDCRVLVGTTTIARSLNLQASGHVITADWVMNPAVMEQIVGRAKRQGSRHRTVFWHQYLTPDTQEDAYLDLLRGEAAMANSVWGEENAVFSALTPEQVLGFIAGTSAVLPPMPCKTLVLPALEEVVSRKTELFLAAKRAIRTHPDYDDQQIADYIGARLIEAQEIITEARKDCAADVNTP